MRLLIDPYVESVARVRALERILLTRTDLEQALDRTSAEDLLAASRFILSGWAGAPLATVQRARQENLVLLNSLTYGAPLVDVFRYPLDVHRLRAFLKASLTGRDTLPQVRAAQGTLPEEYLRGLAGGRAQEGVQGVPDALVEAVDRARASWKTEADLAAVDRLLDEGQLAWQQCHARKFRCRFLSSYFALVADLTNLRSIARAQTAGWSPERGVKLLLEGGTIGSEAMGAAALGGPEAWRELLSNTPYGALATPAGTLEEMEMATERIRITFLRTTREALGGIEPLLAFYLARERDLTTLALIGAGLDTDMPRDAVRRRAGPVWWEN